MIMMRRFLAAAIAALIVGLPAGTAFPVGNGTQAGSFLLIGNGTRATAMGEAFTGLADDVTAASWNVAGLAQLPSLQASLSYAAWFADTSYSVISAGAPVAPDNVLAATLYYFHVPRIANVPDDVEPGVDLSNYAVGASYAFRLYDRFCLGAGLKLMNQDITQSGRPSTAAAGAMVDLGFLYIHDDPQVSAGVALQNMGPKLDFRDSSSPAPFWARIGAAYRAYHDEWLQVTGTFDAAEPVDTGYSLDVPEGGIAEFYKIRIRRPYQNRYNYGFGAECWIADVLALRGGYTVRVGSDISSPSAGAGLKFTFEPLVYSVDYSYSYWGDLSPNVSRVSLSISLRPRPSETAE